MIIQRLGASGTEWEAEWSEEVQGLLERDAGWGWKGFWKMIQDNLSVGLGRKGPADWVGAERSGGTETESGDDERLGDGGREAVQVQTRLDGAGGSEMSSGGGGGSVGC